MIGRDHQGGLTAFHSAVGVRSAIKQKPHSAGILVEGGSNDGRWTKKRLACRLVDISPNGKEHFHSCNLAVKCSFYKKALPVISEILPIYKSKAKQQNE